MGRCSARAQIDALGEQLVAGADGEGDVLVILGTTLIVWVITAGWRDIDGLWTTPSTVPGMVAIGGPSNAGGFFVNWLAAVLGTDPWAAQAPPEDSERVPVWLPYLRGERVPFHDPDRRGSLHDLDVGLGSSALVRAAFEASAFAVRHIVELSGVTPSRIVATGGGVRNRAWLQALADGNDLPVDVVAVPEGAALGAAWLARQAAGSRSREPLRHAGPASRLAWNPMSAGWRRLPSATGATGSWPDDRGAGATSRSPSATRSRPVHGGADVDPPTVELAGAADRLRCARHVVWAFSLHEVTV